MGEYMKCPYCDSELSQSVIECPHCHAHLVNNVEIVKVDTSNKVLNKIKNNENKKYIITFVVCLIVFLILLLVILFKKVDNSRVDNKTDEMSSSPTTEYKNINMTKNKGIYSGLENPINFGEITFATFNDDVHNQSVDVDVELSRVLAENEILDIVSLNNQALNEGFKWVGVEYRITLNDLDYLGNDVVLPILNVSLHDVFYKNSFFLVNENYYTIHAITDNNITPIRNGESTSIRIVYQVPINQNYYLCFGDISKSLGCFNSF